MHDASFLSLNPDLILSSVESIGYIPTGRCVALNSVENRVFDIEIEGGERIIVKFYRPNRWTKLQIQEEHDFLYELKEADIPVLAPILDRQGNSLHESQGLTFAIWPLRTGRIIEELSESDLPQLGRLIGRLHLVGKSKKTKYRSFLTVPDYAEKALDLILAGGWISNAHLTDRYKKAAYFAFDRFETVLKTKQIPFHRIHGDCHKGNLIRSEEGFSILDFDDFLEGPVVQDFWMLLPFGERRSESERELFFEGYREFSEFSLGWLDLIEPLRAIRYVYYASWIAKRWEDPSFQNLFPHFGTDEYWSKETMDLESMAKGFQRESEEESPIAKTSEKEEELSNKDFFWDWEN
ncbi:stress response kinase A (plasmid) [Leptospira kobayashii]|uniref:Stress response kinase A n=1 Tax=Leptospira kobayashii TaxID=1917830 RepID=A0ABN6KI18_9LEPT|nr:serine/threonine protein kinase [Leptospira kobayashii]BDA80932.1 stress response kinase A [Leptospira kobayashii]